MDASFGWHFSCLPTQRIQWIANGQRDWFRGKLFSCSTQLSIKFKLLINFETAQIYSNLRFRAPKPVIHPANKC